jgi:hypothetical protein
MLSGGWAVVGRELEVPAKKFLEADLGVTGGGVDDETSGLVNDKKIIILINDGGEIIFCGWHKKNFCKIKLKQKEE